ncbi:MAG: hypothetical protein AAF328_00160 [Planctomycetota bacterium]
MPSITKTLTAAAATLAFVGFADAASVYSFDLDRQGSKLVNQDGDKIRAGINDKAGKVLGVSGSYDELNQTLSWSTTLATNPHGAGYESFWLVINNGGNPKTRKQEGKLGMIFFDRNGGDPTLSVYQYTSAGANSWKNGKLIASSEIDDSFVLASSFEKESSKGERTGSFTLDVSGINSAMGNGWQGLMFDETVGLWMHLFDHRKPGAQYGSDGELKQWKFGKHGWVDTDGFATSETNAVPTPSAALAGLAGLGLLANRRKRHAA